MSKALALLALTVLSSVYAAEVPQPSWTNHNRIAGSQQMMTNFKPWAESVESTLGDKLDTTNGTANCLGVENGLTVSGDATFSGGYLAVEGDLFVDSDIQVLGRTEFLGNDNYFDGNARFGGESNRFYTVPYMQSNSEETKHFFATLDDINELDGLKRDKTDNVCHKTEFTEWTFSSSPENDELISQLDPSKLIRDDSVPSTWIWWYSGEPADYAVFVNMIRGNENDTEVTGFRFERKDVSGVPYEVTATRSAICVSNDIFVTWTSTTNGVNAAIAANNVGYRVRESVAWSGAAELAMNANGVSSADETRSGAQLFDQIDGKATKTELADRYTIKSETFTNDVSAVVTNDVERWTISGTPKAKSYYWIWFDPDHPIALLKDGNEDVSERPYTQGVKTLHFTLSYSSDPIDITARLMTENALGLAYSKDIPAISATDPTFSNAVLSVQISTNDFAALYELKNAFAELPIDPVTGGISIGSLLAALASAVVWLKKNKVQTLKLEDNSVETSAAGGVAKLDAFFTGSNSLLTGTIDAEVISKGTAPDAHLEAPTDEHLKLILADNSVVYDSAKALPYKLTSVIGDRVVATMTLTAASTDITLPTISANDTTVKDVILDVTNAYAVEGVATDAGINIPRTDFKLVTRDGESLTAVTTVKAGKSAFICFTQKSPVVVDGTTYPCWCVIQLPFGDPS